ncbi:MAG TPA: pyridoxamine 5'-phosphate oxidase [Thermoanaerobaculia bacterium]
MDLADLRRDYVRAMLDLPDLDADPVVQFQAWLAEAIAAKLPEPTAMTLATADREGRPSARIVLLKGCDARGFVFYSNYASRKGAELAANPHAALLFHWPELDRQVRIEGVVERTTREESEAYFASRPRPSRLGAWASRQSAPLQDRAELERALAAVEARFPDDIPLPGFWGGFRVRPDAIELWQGRASRLHDRFRYTRAGDGEWRIERLSP